MAHEKEECAGCLAWSYSGSYFGREEGTRMDGWCRVLNKTTRQDYWCPSYSSRAKQESEYLARVKATNAATKDGE